MKKPTIKLPRLVNTEAMHEQHPDTFELLPRQDRESIKPGDCAKVSTGAERFWVLVTELEPGPVFLGTVDSVLLFERGQALGYGDRIKFAPENVYEIMTAEEIAAARQGGMTS